MIRQSESVEELLSALDRFQRDHLPVRKTAENDFFKSKYADLYNIKAVCDPTLVENNLVLTQWLGGAEYGLPTLITRLHHLATGQWMEAETPLLLAKDEPQSHGSAITYVRRYAYCAILGIVADPDDDGEKAQQPYRGRTENVNGDEIPAQPRAQVTRTGPGGANVATVSEKQGKMLYAMTKTVFGGDADVSAEISDLLGRTVKRTDEVYVSEFDHLHKALKAAGA